MQTVFDSNRYGFNRKIVNTSPGEYRWTITRDGQVISTNTERTLVDARRVVKSTTNFLYERKIFSR